MPVITSKSNHTQQEARTSDNWTPPKRSITANTQAQSISNPFSAQPQETQETEPTKEVTSTGQLNNKEDVSKEVVTLSPQLTALARREQKFRQEQQAFKAEQARVEQEKTETAELRALKAKLEAKDFSVLDKLGVSYEDYQQFKLNELEGTTPEAQAIGKLQEEINNLKTQREQEVDKQYESTVAQYRKDIKQLVAKDPAFESIKETAAEEHVLQHILDTFNEDGEVLSVEEAAKEIEDAIVEDAMKMSSLKKVQAKLAPPPKKILPPPQRTGTRTITQQMTPSTTTTRSFQSMSPRERLAAAVAKAQRPNE